MVTTKTSPAPAKKTVAKAPAKKAPPAKTATPSTSAVKAVPAATTTPSTKPKAEAKRPRITPSTDAQHQAWQAAKKDLTAVMAELLYDSRRVVPDHAKSPEEAYAKVGAALKVLTEFTQSIRVKG